MKSATTARPLPLPLRTYPNVGKLVARAGRRIRGLFGLTLSRFGGNASERLFSLATLAVIAVGIFFRVRGSLFDVIPFWLDECAWGNFLLEQPLRDHLIRPLGFMAVSKLAALWFEPSEISLRALPLAAGIGTTLIAPALARHLFTSFGARFLLIAIIALHPGAIDLSKEFKPYSVGLFLHFALILLGLRYLAQSSARRLFSVLAVAVLGVLFSQDVLFAYPGLFALLAWHAFRERKPRQLLAVVLGATTAFAVIMGLYFLMWKRIDAHGEAVYWGQKYDVFYAPRGEPSFWGHLRWALDTYADVSSLPGYRRIKWHSHTLDRPMLGSLKHIDAAIWLLLHAIGVLTIAVRRSLRHALLLLAPLAVLLAFNWIGRFPFGVFRSDLFVLAYIAPIAALALDRRSESRFGALTFPVPALVLVIAPLVAFESGWHRTKQYFASVSGMPTLIRQLASAWRHEPRPVVLTLQSNCQVFRFFTEHHRDHAEYKQLLGRYELNCTGEGEGWNDALRRSIRRPHSSTWVIAGPLRAFRRSSPLLRHAKIRVYGRAAFSRIYKVER